MTTLPPLAEPPIPVAEPPGPAAAAAAPVSAPEPRWPARVGLTLLGGSLLAFLALTLLGLNRPLVYDDVNFAFAAQGVARTGLPIGNAGWMSDRHDYSKQFDWALWHPPLYIYTIGLAAKLFGETAAALRLVGLLGGLASGVLVFLLASDLTRGPRGTKWLAGGIAAALMLLNPLFLQSALILDIDFALLLPLTLLFLLLYLRLEDTRRWWLLAPLLGVILWAKMTNPLPLLATIVAWQVLRGRFLRALSHGLGIGIGGAALFAATWLAIGTWLGFPLDRPFLVNLGQWQDSSDVARRAFVSVEAFLNGVQGAYLWLGPGLVALGLGVAALRGGQLALRWEMRRVDLLIGLLVLLVLGYVNKSAGGFPKYQVAFTPLLAAAAAPLLAYTLRAYPRLAIAGAAATIAFAYVTVRLIRDQWVLTQAWGIAEDAGSRLLGVLLAAILAGACLYGARRAPRVLPASALVALAALAFGWSLGMDRVQVRAPYSTTYWYGTTGVVDAAAWVDANVPPGTVYAANKEVAYHARNQQYLDADTLATFVNEFRQFDGTWMGHPIDAVVVWVREPYMGDLYERELPPLGYRQTEMLGHFAVYQR